MSDLTLNQTRVIGCLIEKSITTPDIYPLSLNSLTTACNQKSNRDPVMDLSESDVQETIDELMKLNFISEERFGGRVPKYKHRFYNTEFSEFRFSDKQTALVCLLFLRGPQTPGELRTRSSRLAEFKDIQDIEATLESLNQHSHGPFVVKLEREPGKRESRYAHLFSGEVETCPQRNEASSTIAASDSQTTDISQTTDNGDLQDRVSLLEMELEEVKSELSSLKQMLEDLLS